MKMAQDDKFTLHNGLYGSIRLSFSRLSPITYDRIGEGRLAPSQWISDMLNPITFVGYRAGFRATRLRMKCMNCIRAFTSCHNFILHITLIKSSVFVPHPKSFENC